MASKGNEAKACVRVVQYWGNMTLPLLLLVVVVVVLHVEKCETQPFVSCCYPFAFASRRASAFQPQFLNRKFVVLPSQWTTMLV